MKMTGDVAEWLQITLRGLAVDEDSCASVIGGHITEIPGRSAARWQFGLDMIFRLNKKRANSFPLLRTTPLMTQLNYSGHSKLQIPFFGQSGVLWNGYIPERNGSPRCACRKNAFP